MPAGVLAVSRQFRGFVTAVQLLSHMCFILQQCPPTVKTWSELVAHIYERISKSEEVISEPKQALIKAINQNTFVGGKEESVSIVRHNVLIAQFAITDLIRE